MSNTKWLRASPVLGLLGVLALPAQSAEVALSRLDCGGAPAPHSVAAFSDTFAYPDLQQQLVYSCYLVRHGDRYMVWDTGQPADWAARAPPRPPASARADASGWDARRDQHRGPGRRIGKRRIEI